MRWLAAVAALAVVGTAGAATYQWTPAQTAAQIVRWQPDAWANDVLNQTATSSARCVKLRVGQFRCAVTGRQYGHDPVKETWWVKVRKQGAGQPCVSNLSLAAIPYGCVNPTGSRVRGDDNKAEDAAEAKARLQHPGWQGVNVSCDGYGAGYYTCQSSGERFAAVSFSPSKVSVSLTG